MKTQPQPCPKVCRECPFRRASAPGYLGECSGDPWSFLTSFAHGEAPLPCHMTVDWASPDRRAALARASLCRGALHMLANQCKLPMDTHLASAVREVGKNDEVFAHPKDFMQHHHNEAIRLSFEEMKR